MNIFYEPNINQDQIVLNEIESRHCVKVLRLRENDRVKVIDGKGNMHQCVIQKSHYKNCILKVNQTISNYNQRDYYLHIAIAPTKNIDRFEWFLEKSTEIGIDEITPVICERSERKIIKPGRLKKIIQSAMKQSLNAYYPKLNQLISYSEFIKNINGSGIKLIGYCNENKKSHIKDVMSDNNKYTILIGPEGDFRENEIKYAIENNFQPVTLGQNRYRTETAGVIACHAINLKY